METSQIFGTEKISKVLLKMAPPVMLAQLIQALYNIVDSLFVGRYAESGLTALSIIYPIQLLMIALAVGTGVGINTVMAARLGTGQKDEADEYAGVGTPLAVAMWFVFALVCWLIMPAYARMSTSSEAVIQDVVTYGRIVCVFSFGLFLESIWTKVLQATGDMKTPMFAQIIGAVTNIVLDPLLIFGMLGLPEMGFAGAAIATVAGQIVAALVVMGKGTAQIACSQEVRRSHQDHLPSGRAEHADAVGVYLLHPWSEPDSCRLFRSGGHGAWPVLQMADLLLHPAGSHADLHRAHRQLQLRCTQH